MADIVRTLIRSGMFNTLITALDTAGMIDSLKAPGPFTIFAPNDPAFTKLPQGVLQDLLGDISKLRDTLLYHIADGEFTSDDILEMDTIQSIQGQEIIVDTTSGIMVDNATIVEPDIACDNGIIHAINALIMPSIRAKAK